MNHIEKQCKVAKTVPISSTVNYFLQQQYDTIENDSKKNFVSIGGITKDLKYAWIANGPKFQVIAVENGSRVASWLFGGILRDKKASITCVIELSNNIGTPPLFIIGLDCEASGGMICVFNIMGSKIIRTIHLDDRVYKLHIIDSGDNIPGILKNLDGILVVGTCGGNTYLIDLCKHMWITENIFNDTNYNKLFKRSCNQINLGLLESYRAHAIQNNEHLALQLNESTNSLFLLSTPKGADALQLPRDKVRISSFLYVPKLISILIGYNFGAWQIYNLLTLELEYTSPVYDEIVPVSYFAFQEPSDDPRAFCYVWAVYSNDIDSKHASVPLAAMYALAYESKDHIDYYGVLYQNFMSCSLRFQMDLLPINNTTQSAKGGHCISLQTCMMNSSNNFDSTNDHNLTLCMIVWCVWSEYKNEPSIIMAVIDLDQWYKEQMPATLRDHGNESYIAQFDLSRILNIEDSFSIFNVNIDSTSISPFTTVQRLEEHYYPTALTFDFIVMQKTEFTFIRNNGLQRTLLLTLEKNGVNSFLNAQNLARQCSEAGLHSMSNSDILSPKLKSQEISSAHTYLLSLALEYNLIGLLTSCAKEWATGAYASIGCTLGVFVEWAIQRSEILQQKTNELCVSLFDYSDINLDCNARKTLDQCAIQMSHLSSVFKLIKKNCTEYLNTTATIEINEHLRAIQMFSDRLEVLQWLLNVGLLPEAPIKSYLNSIDLNERMRAPYPAEELCKYYNERRSQLNEDTTSTISKNKSCELLFIDNLIEHECGGERLRNEWRCDINLNGLYPPPSIQALLRTYLIDNVDLKYKHTILVYVFLDLAMTLDQTKYESIITHLIKFPAVFHLTPCHIKMTQAFWQLDHGDFMTGMEQLLDPLIGGGTIQDEFKPWQHRTVLKTLLANKQHKYAALYIQIRQPPFADLNEIINAMYLLLSNNMLHAAFEFQRRHQTMHNKSQLLEKFFEGCLQENLITSTMKLSLSQDEEDSLIEVLRKHNKEDINLQLIYFLQRSRGFDVLRIGDKFYQNQQRGAKMGLIGQNLLQLPQILLNTYASAMPNITKKIYDDFRTDIVGQKLLTVKKVKAPTPMSVKIKESNNSIKYKSNSIINSINKIRETWSLFNGNNDNNECIESTPFLCTPKRKIHEHQSVTPVTYPKITYQNQEINMKKRATDDNLDDDLTIDSKNPSKRFKYTSNETMSDVRLLTPSHGGDIQKQNHTAPEKLLLTPIVKRKFSESPKGIDNTPSSIPSILKIRESNSKKTTTRGRSITPKLEDCVDSSSEESVPTSPSIIEENNYSNANQLQGHHIPSTEKEDRIHIRSKLGATPRKNLTRTPRPVVHFEDVSSNEKNIQTFETITDESISNKIETILSNKNNESVKTSDVHFEHDEYKLREEEMKSVARKLSRTLSSPYKSIKPRKSLQRTVLESSLVKNITPVLKRSKRIANRQASSNVCEDDLDNNETDNESFDKNVTICSSPTTIKDDLSSSRKLLKRKQLNDDNFIQIMEEKYSHETASSFSSNNNGVVISKNIMENDDSVVTDSFINRMNEKYPDDSTNSFENYSIEVPKMISTRIGDIVEETKTDVKMSKIPSISSKCNQTTTNSLSSDNNSSNDSVTINKNIVENDDSFVSESFINRMNEKYPDESSSFENDDIESSKTIIAETKGEVKLDEIPTSVISNESMITCTNIKGNTDNSVIIKSITKQISLEDPKILNKKQDERSITLNFTQQNSANYMASNSKIIIDDENSKTFEICKSQTVLEDDTVVTQSFIERMEEKYDNKEESTWIQEVSFENPKMIPKRLGDMFVETIEPMQMNVNVDEILSPKKLTSNDLQSNSLESGDSLVSESFIQRMEKKYDNYETSTTNVSIVNSTTSVYTSIDTNKEFDIISSKETSSVYCSIEEIVENDKNSIEELIISEDDDYSFRMEVDDDDEDEEQNNKSTSSEGSSEHDDKNSEEVEKSENSSDHEKDNEIVEISSDDDDENEKTPNSTDNEEKSNEDEENSCDSNNSSVSYNQDIEIIENETIGLNERIVYEQQLSSNQSNKNINVTENIKEIIEISEVTEVEKNVCDVYEDLEVVVEFSKDNQEIRIDDNQSEKITETHEIFEIGTPQEELKTKLTSEKLDKTIETVEIQQDDTAIISQYDHFIEVIETDENQQQIENQNESNKNVLLNNDNILDAPNEENSNCNVEFKETKQIIKLERQEDDTEPINQSEKVPDMLEIQETNISTGVRKTSDSAPLDEKVLPKSVSRQTIDEIQSEKENAEEAIDVKPRRRTRQNSVDSYKSETPLPVISKPLLRSRRAASIDITSPNPTTSAKVNKNTPQKRVTRSSSDINISTCQSKVVTDSKSIGTRQRSLRSSNSKDDDTADKSIIEEYSTSRRLTRKQKTMLEKIELPKILPKRLEENDSDKNSDDNHDDEIRGSTIEKIDPIKLLDKKSFEGPVDPDEQKILLQRSPASSVKTTSSFQSTEITESRPKLRNLRSRSIDLDMPLATNKTKLKSSSSSDIVGVTTPQRKMTRRLSQLSLNQTPEKDESESGSQISTRSKSSIVKRLKDLSPDVRRSPRRSSRLGSPQSISLDEQKGSNTSIKTTRRSILQSDLPVISEEIEQQSRKKRKDTEEHGDSSAKRNRSKLDVEKKSSKEEIKTTATNRRKKL